MARRTAIDVEFVAELLKSPAKGGWTYLVWPGSAEFFGTRGLVKVRGAIDGRPFESAFMAIGAGVPKLPAKAGLAGLLGNQAGDLVTRPLPEANGWGRWL